jgi:broad specificity phosphatase PhoE
MIFLMRHGESSVNVARIVKCRELDGDLTDKGRKQAHLFGQWLSNKPIQRIRASPFHRAQQSAEIVGEILGLPVETDDDLREIDCGTLEGRADPEAWGLWEAASSRWQQGEWNADFAGGETLRHAHDRLQRALMRACEQDTLLVTHGGILVRILPYLVSNMDQWPKTDHLENTGLIILESEDDGRFACGGWNLVEHLSVDSNNQP